MLRLYVTHKKARRTHQKPEETMYNRISERYHKKKKRQKRIALCAGILVGAIIAILIFANRGTPDIKGSMKLMPFSANDTYAPYSAGVVYQKGNKLSAINEKQETLFETNVELLNATLLTQGDVIVLHNETALQAINLKGEILFTKAFENIQYVRSCATNVAVMALNAENKQVITVLDLHGNPLTTILFDYKLLDFGFMDDGTIWSLVLDTSKVTFSCTITTYKNNGNTINGITNIDSQMIQSLMFSKSNICAVGTNHIIVCNYIGEKLSTELIYGWQLLDSTINAKDQSVYLLAPRTENAGAPVYSSVKVVSINPNSVQGNAGNASSTTQLPPECFNVLLTEGKFYAFTQDTLYVYDTNCKLLQENALPFKPDAVVRAYGNNVFISNGVEVYLAKLS
ncbi:DUF5711 family protein [Clostridia bacterium OttesenSCG-928-F22]|nr:DUF5711 family protein [Clostridia bacterium OttesenSCG-928-F22]